MRRVRAFAFNSLFYGLLILYMLAFLVILVLPRSWGFPVVRNLMRNEIRLQRLFGIRIEVRNPEYLPQGGGIVAAKHQSMWETFSLVAFIPWPAFIYKQELGKIPLFGNYLRKFGMIPVDRKGGATALRAMATLARAAIDSGRQVLIFPEGTRRPYGAAPAYKFGVAKMYAEIGRPVTPLVLNSGLYWSAYFWRGYPGTIVIEALPPIEPGLTAEQFFERMQTEMERASDRLLLETASRPDAPPLDAIAQARVDALRAQPAGTVGVATKIADIQSSTGS